MLNFLSLLNIPKDITLWMRERFKAFTILKSSPQNSVIVLNPLPNLNVKRRRGFRYFWSTHPVLLINSV